MAMQLVAGGGFTVIEQLCEPVSLEPSVTVIV